MTTFIAGDNYIAADRAVLLNGVVFEDAKVRIIKNRIAYFFGSVHPTDDERKMLEKAIYDFMFAKEKNHIAAEKWLLSYIRSNILVVMTRKKIVKIDAISKLLPWSAETNSALPHTGLNVVEQNPNTPVVYGSGAELAQVGWACGQSPRDIILTVQRIDPMSGRGCDVVYKEDLRA